MCELFGISSAEKIPCNELLREFYSHGVEHPDGWGLASFYGGAVSLEKEPVSSVESVYLKNRLTDNIVEDILLAHIRKASVGGLSYVNSHPFARRDRHGRLWVMIHNGTIFDSPELAPYKQRQRGETDSERILYYLVDQINAGQGESHTELLNKDRFAVVNQVIHKITPKNKVNLLIYDGELLYIHTNHQGSLHLCQKKKTLLVSTKPLNQDHWTQAPLNTLLAYRSGTLELIGERHTNEYIKVENSERVSGHTDQS